MAVVLDRKRRFTRLDGRIDDAAFAVGAEAREHVVGCSALGNEPVAEGRASKVSRLDGEMKMRAMVIPALKVFVRY